MIPKFLGKGFQDARGISKKVVKILVPHESGVNHGHSPIFTDTQIASLGGSPQLEVGL
jgi:hypothetical protein